MSQFLRGSPGVQPFRTAGNDIRRQTQQLHVRTSANTSTSWTRPATHRSHRMHASAPPGEPSRVAPPHLPLSLRRVLAGTADLAHLAIVGQRVTLEAAHGALLRNDLSPISAHSDARNTSLATSLVRAHGTLSSRRGPVPCALRRALRRRCVASTEAKLETGRQTAPIAFSRCCADMSTCPCEATAGFAGFAQGPEVLWGNPSHRGDNG